VNITGFDLLDIYNSEQETESESGISFDAGAPDGRHYTVKSGFEQLPVVFVDYWDAVRYANWRHNGAAPGSNTEEGAYTLEGYSSTPTNAESLAGRNPGARYFLPNADEWYKAAYYVGGGNYATYPTSQNTVNNDAPPGDAESANYDGSTLRPVGSYPDARNRHLLYDMGGNVDEFVEKSSTGDTVLNMGGRYDGASNLLSSASWNAVSSTTTARYRQTGFRIAAAKE
jgi:formylglycine-generating enzyme required for sulfatase activity